MPGTSVGDITVILKAVREGVPGAAQELIRTVQSELRELAHGQRNRQGPSRTLQTTALVNEAYLRLFRRTEPSWENRHHFFWAASRAMHDVLVEQARHHAAQKREGGRKAFAISDDIAMVEQSQDLLDLSEALARLQEFAREPAEVVMLRFFGGLTHEDCAEILGVSEITVRRRWAFAKAWLRAALADNAGSKERPGDF